MKRIWVFRHGKSSWANDGQGDFDRPLAGRGRKDGEEVERWLFCQKEKPELMYVSDALRTRETAAFIQRGSALDDDSVFLEHRLYSASPETFLECVRATPDDIQSVAFVGHNPTSTQFINLMTGATTVEHMPTLGIARLKIADDQVQSWQNIGFGQAELDCFVTPKLLR